MDGVDDDASDDDDGRHCFISSPTTTVTIIWAVTCGASCEVIIAAITSVAVVMMTGITATADFGYSPCHNN